MMINVEVDVDPDDVLEEMEVEAIAAHLRRRKYDGQNAGDLDGDMRRLFDKIIRREAIDADLRRIAWEHFGRNI